MISEDASQLLTAYVDGELNEPQRRAVERLLQQSAEAQALLRRLQADAASLRRLPKRRPEEDLVPAVMASITANPFAVAAPLSSRPLPANRAWARYAVAAAVAAAACLTIFVFYYLSVVDSQVPAIARNDQRPPKRAREAMLVESPDADSSGADVVTDKQRPGAIEPDKRLVNQPPAPANVATPKPASGGGTDVLASPNPAMEVFQVFNVREALSLSLQDLKQEAPRKQLRDALQKQSAYRLELFSTGQAKALDRLEAAFQAQGFQFLIEPLAEARLRTPYWKTDLVLYAEGLTPEELEKLLAQAGVEEARPGTQRRSVAFRQLFVLPLAPADHQELSKLLGVDPTRIDPASKAPLGVDVRQPLAKTTADELRKTLAQGAPRPAPDKALAFNGPPRPALVLAYNPVRNATPAASRVIQQYLATRLKFRPGTLRVLLILRGVNG